MSWLDRNDETAAKICVVDDDAAVRHAMANLLEAGGYEPIGFDSGEAFLSWPHLADIDVALFDVKLRGMNGFALQEQFSALGLGVPLLLISGHSDRDMEQRALRGGALALLRKPVDPDVLFEQIERALEARRISRDQY
jgi:FixJ family two-component response regulator